MKKSLVLLGLVALIMVLAASMAAAQGQGYQGQFGGFTITVNHIAPGQGTFDIYGGEDPEVGPWVDVSGSFEVIMDKETRTYSVKVTLDEGSYALTADGTPIDLSAKEFTYSGELGKVRVIPNIINWLQGLLES